MEDAGSGQLRGMALATHHVSCPQPAKLNPPGGSDHAPPPNFRLEVGC
jgi:hypothetical protein